MSVPRTVMQRYQKLRKDVESKSPERMLKAIKQQVIIYLNHPAEAIYSAKKSSFMVVAST